MSSPPIQPAQPPAESSRPSAEEIEYKKITEFLKYLVGVASGTIVALAGIAGLLFWSSMRDLREDAKQTARVESQKAIDAALEKPEIQGIISNAVKAKVGPAVDAEIQKSFGEKVHSLESQQEGFADLSMLAAA